MLSPRCETMLKRAKFNTRTQAFDFSLPNTLLSRGVGGGAFDVEILGIGVMEDDGRG